MIPENDNNTSFEKKNIDLVIRILLLILLLAWCGMIVFPFAIPVLWGIILAIALNPIYARILSMVRGRRRLAGTITSGLIIIILIIPFVWLVSTIVEGLVQFITSIKENTLVIPPPDPSVADWPVIGDPVYKTWTFVTVNIESAILQYKDQIIAFGEKFLGAVSNVTSNFFLLLLSIILSGILMTGSEKYVKVTGDLAKRLIGGRSDEFTEIVVLTIRNVAKGILGVAFIQFVLLGTAFILAKIPFAGLWALIVLLLAIVQLPSGIVGIPVIIYLFSSREPGEAILWSSLILLFSLSDNFLKPIIMGKGAPVPMLVIFLGAIGGMIMSGILGLFTGAIVLSLGYKLAGIWFEPEKKKEGQ